MDNKTNWNSVKLKLEVLKDRYRVFSDVEPRPIMIKLIVWLDRAINEIESSRKQLK